MLRYDDFRPDDPPRAIVGLMLGGAVLFVSAVVTVLGWGFFFVGMARVFG